MPATVPPAHVLGTYSPAPVLMLAAAVPVVATVHAAIGGSVHPALRAELLAATF